MIIALLALAVALSGGAWAVNSKINGAAIRNGTISPAKLTVPLRQAIARKPVRGPRGVPGIPGPAGAAGAAGAAGTFSAANVTQVAGPLAVMGPAGSTNPIDIAGSLATCPQGSTLVGGGWIGDRNPAAGYSYPFQVSITSDGPIGASWNTILVNNGPDAAAFHAVAICAR